jgi:phage terminase large subunit-like protein
MSRHGRYIKFIQTYCRAPKGTGHGKLMRLATFQKSWLEEALAEGISTAVMPTPSGNGKSTFGGAVSVAATFMDDESGEPQVPIIATTIGQAIRSVYGVAASMVKHEPELARRSVTFTGIATPRIWVPYNEGLLFPISNDIDGIQGLDPSLAIVDELGFQPVAVWSSMLARDGKREQSLIWGTGTPGFDRDNALWAIREMVIEGRKPVTMAWREYAADPGCDIGDRGQWRKANPALVAGFMRESGLVSALGMPEAHFRILRLGQWVDGVDGWLGKDGRAVWDRGDSDYALVPGAPTWAGVDVGLKRDSTSVCWVQRRIDEPSKFHAEFKVWVPTVDEPVDTTDVMGFLRDLDDRYRLQEISFDPRFFDVPAKLLLDEGLRMVEIPQSPERMTPVCGDLYALLMAVRITHDRDPMVEQQVLNAIPRLNERGFTLSKGKSRGRIDSAISLGLAIDRATHPGPGPFRSNYSDAGLTFAGS